MFKVKQNIEIKKIMKAISEMASEKFLKEILKKAPKMSLKDEEKGMWVIPEKSLEVALPPRFFLKENEHFVSLFYRYGKKKRRVATFLITEVTPTSKIIRRRALKYLKKEKKGNKGYVR